MKEFIDGGEKQYLVVNFPRKEADDDNAGIV